MRTALLAAATLLTSCGPARHPCRYEYQCAAGSCVGVGSGQAGCFATEAECKAAVDRLVTAAQGTVTRITFEQSTTCAD